METQVGLRDVAEDVHLPKQHFAGVVSSQLTPRESAGVTTSSVSSLYAYQVRERRTELSRHGLRSSKSILRAALAAVASLAATALLLFVCREFKASVVDRGIVRRRLSDNEESSSSELQRVCTALESASAPLVRLEHEKEEEEPSEPSAKIPKLHTHEAGRGGPSQPVSGGGSHSDAEALVPSFPAESEQRIQFADPRFSRSEASHAMTHSAHQQAHASTSDLGGASSGAPELSAYELEAANALILLQAQALRNATAQHVAPSGRRLPAQQQASPGVHAVADLPGTDVAAVSPASLTETQQSTVVQTPPFVAARAAAQQETVSEIVVPSSSSAGRLPAAEVQAMSEERFARLPSIQAGRCRPLIDPEFIVDRYKSHPRTRLPLSGKFRPLAKMLTKEMLSPKEVKVLARQAESLMIGILRHEFGALPAVSVAHAVAPLARRFLVLNALHSALQILGHSTEQQRWWATLCEEVSHDYKAPTEDRQQESLSQTPAQKSHGFNVKLAGKLVDAIDTLMEGRRPEKDQLIELNKMLFFNKLSPVLIKDTRWNIWK